ncbi:MAG: hypothetical protein KF784_08485 [Fimbriimonadaceae bacterium]|nr:hypothetical protein [Fimbriimonadaceae bacterium]
MTRRLSIRAVFAMIAVAASLFVFAQVGTNIPTAKATMDAKTTKAGAVAKGKVVLTFAEGWHGYQNPPMGEYEIPVKVESATKDVKIKVTYPKGIVKDLMGATTAVYEGSVDIPFEFTTSKKPGDYKVKIKISYQQCNDSSCLPPGSITLEVPVKVVK